MGYIDMLNKIINRSYNENSIFNFLKKNNISEEQFFNMLDYIKKNNLLTIFLESYSYKIIEAYIDSDFEDINSFYKDKALTKQDFCFALSQVKIYNSNLYNEYINKENENNNQKNKIIKEKISEIVEKIKNKDIDNLEFLKLVPFKTSKNYLNSLFIFLKEYMSEEEMIIKEYLDNNKKLKFKRFTPLKIKDKESSKIYKYMNENNYPIYEELYNEVNDMLYKGNFNANKYKKLDLIRKENVK